MTVSLSKVENCNSIFIIIGTKHNGYLGFCFMLFSVLLIKKTLLIKDVLFTECLKWIICIAVAQ